MTWRQLSTVIRFELKRSTSLPRMAWWLGLALFPVLIVTLLTTVDDGGPDRDAWTFILFTLIPLVVSALSLLLWATPIVQSELEANTWAYLAIRPHGKLAVLLGKYLTAIIWTISACWTGLTLSLLIAKPDEGWHIWIVLSKLIFLSAISYGALLTFLGVLFHKRPAVAAVAYGLLFEFIVAMVPAVINQVTVQYRLRTLLVLWYDWNETPPAEVIEYLAGTGPPAKHVVVLLAISSGWLIAAVYLIHRKSLVTASDV